MVEEEGVEDGGGVGGGGVTGRSVRGYQTAVCVHIVTQCGCDEAYFALQSGVECRMAEAERVLVRCCESLRWFPQLSRWQSCDIRK